jgi:ATP-dependent exoDNAse (exonuclease V) alpha subunit
VKEPLILSREFQAILHQMDYGADHLFITGKAGTGKSTLLQVFRNTTKKRVAVLAPTGIAALNVRGQTIHSFFGFPPRLINTSEIERRKNYRIFQNIDMIIIDEISMVRADLIDNIHIFLQVNRRNKLPFGGVQMVFFGDMFQLPPVVANPFEREYFATTYASPYFFSAHIMQTVKFQMIELYEVYRQAERKFIRLLDNIRQNQLDYDDLMEINERYMPLPEDTDYYITLTSRNDLANTINNAELSAIHGPVYEYKASISGDFNPQLFPTEHQLILKEGAQVMFVKNDLQKQYVNGTIGKVSYVDGEKILVKIPDENGTEKEIEVIRQDWEILKYERDPNQPDRIMTRVTGVFTQYPLKLAWAITIHKSQGKTFDRVIIDLGSGAFEAGQTYVALSRCRTLEGIILKRPLKPRDIIVDERICEFYEQIRYLS